MLFIFVLSLIKLSINVGCTDTPSWNNGYGHDCNSYSTRWCENGAAKPGQEWTLGAKYKYPENNCCVCGKGNSNYNLTDLNHIILFKQRNDAKDLFPDLLIDTGTDTDTSSGV